jgi:hypothetical protein
MKRAACIVQTALKNVAGLRVPPLDQRTTVSSSSHMSEYTSHLAPDNSTGCDSQTKIENELPTVSGSSSFDKTLELIQRIKSHSPHVLHAIPGNVLLSKHPQASEIAAWWIQMRNSECGGSIVEIEVPVKVLQRAVETFTTARQWSFLFTIQNSMQTSTTGITCLHSRVIRDVVGDHADAAVIALLKTKSLFTKSIEPARDVTATGYRLAQSPDPKAPSISSKNSRDGLHKFLSFQEVTHIEPAQHRRGLGLVGGGLVGSGWCNKTIDGQKDQKLVGLFRVNSVRLIVDLAEPWDRIRGSMSKRWGHLDAAADGAGRLDVVSEAEAIEIATRHLRPDDDEKTRAGQIAAAVEFTRYVRMDRESRLMATKWRGGRIFIPGLNLRRDARQELFRFGGEQLVKVDVRGCYWWILAAEIRRSLLLTRETQKIRDQIKTTRVIDNIERLLCIISAGKFYDFLSSKCGIEASKIKKRINRLCLFTAGQLRGPEFDVLKAEWPEVVAVINRLRSQPGFTSTASRFLNGLEGQLMNEPLKAVAKAGHAVSRIHDCLSVPPLAVDDAVAAIRFRAEERFGIVPGLKCEYPDGRQVPHMGEIAADSAGVSDRYWMLALPSEEALNELADRVVQSVIGAESVGLAV